MRNQLLVIILLHRYFFEALSFVEGLCRFIADLNVEVNGFDDGFRMGNCRLDNMLQALRAQPPRPIRLMEDESVRSREGSFKQ